MKIVNSTFAVAAMMLFASAFSTAGAETNGIQRSDITVPVYEGLYEKQGPSKSVPKMFVFSSKGECVGVTTTDQTPVTELRSFIDQSLEADNRRCEIVASDTFGVTEVGPSSVRDKPSLLLVVFNVDFCTGCDLYKRELAAMAGEWGDRFEYLQVGVSFD